MLRWAQPVVLLALLGVGAGDQVARWRSPSACSGWRSVALDASMNMLGVSLQRAYGRSIMLGFHAAYSLGGIVGASLAWAGAHWHLSLFVSYLPVVAVLLPARSGREPVVRRRGPAAGRRRRRRTGGRGRAGPLVFRLLLPLCLVMAFAYIGDSTVSNWSAKYLQDVLGSSEQLATVPYNVYMVTTLLGRAVGDFGVRRFGAVAVVRLGRWWRRSGSGWWLWRPGPGWGCSGSRCWGSGCV